jgi:hypothetical protein
MSNYPKASIIWPGAILGTITKSIATAVNGDFDSFQSWSGNNYTIQGWDGRYGAITFQGPQGPLFQAGKSSVVGAFYSAMSRRCPHIGDDCHATLESVFQGCPERHRRLAETGALQFLLFEAHPRGPCATVAFWNDGDYLAAVGSWDIILANGADLIRIQLIDNVEDELGAWAEEYHLSEVQIDLARSLYWRKLNKPDKNIRLSESEAAYLFSLSDDPTARQNCKISFADIGVGFP